MTVARAVAYRSDCVRQYGAVIVSATNRILSTGYNGAPRGLSPHPLEVVTGTCADWCEHATSDNPSPCYDDCYSIHAEANALAFVDRTLMEGGCAYVTSNPCWMCAKQLANSGISRVVFKRDAEYRSPDKVIDLFQRCGIEVVQWDSTT